MKVLRVENTEHAGMYVSSTIPLWKKHAAYDIDGHRPDPPNDAGLVRALDTHPDLAFEVQTTDDWRFGFKTMAQLRSWLNVPPLVRDLEKAGFHVAQYSVPKKDVVEGVAQVVYRKREAREVLDIPLGWAVA